ncbi:MAG: YcaO-like family protein [Methanolinea sp.]|jgi:ribosomal protein S12 methylthiotransferase accessory factor|nr:YcaO-like family protein [Methanolinea sp.]
MDSELNRVEKRFFYGTHRICAPKETAKRARPLMKSIGAGPVREITGNDRVGIPCCTTSRSRTPRGGSKVHPGMGLDLPLARVSAMMAAIERYSGEYHEDHMEFAGYEDLGVARAIDPETLILPRPLERGEKLHWTPGVDIMNKEQVMVPSNAVFFPYDTLGMTMPLFQSDPAGLASGNVREEAILHGLLELLERDAMSRAERQKDMGRRLVIDTDGPARALLDQFTSAGVAIHLWLLRGRSRIPVIAAAADDQVTRDPALLMMGSGCHPDPDIAAVRALTELAFNRAAYLRDGISSASREMLLSRAGYERMKRINREWFVEAPEIPLSGLDDVSAPWIDEDIFLIVDELSATVERVCVVDLSRTTVPVVRVIVPGLEVSHLHKNRRARKAE